MFIEDYASTLCTTNHRQINDSFLYAVQTTLYIDADAQNISEPPTKAMDICALIPSVLVIFILNRVKLIADED